MQNLKWRRWEIDYDRARTAQAFQAFHAAGPERCGCADCRNFIAQRGLVWTEEVLQVFDALGVPEPPPEPRRAGEPEKR